MNARRLILIRHSQSQPIEGMPADRWALTERGRERCLDLAGQLKIFKLSKLWCSHEQKARETAELVAARLSLEVEVADRVHEHVRRDVPFLSEDQFKATVRRLFREPMLPVFGLETAAEALARFSIGLDDIVARVPQGDVAVVTHGTVMSLFAGAHSNWDPYRYWRQLDQPAFAVFRIPSLTLAHTAFTV